MLCLCVDLQEGGCDWGLGGEKWSIQFIAIVVEEVAGVVFCALWFSQQYVTIIYDSTSTSLGNSFIVIYDNYDDCVHSFAMPTSPIKNMSNVWPKTCDLRGEAIIATAYLWATKFIRSQLTNQQVSTLGYRRINNGD